MDDLNRDGNLDVVAVGSFSGGVVLLGDGTGRFLSGSQINAFGGSNARVAIGDFTSDNILDLLNPSLTVDTYVGLGDGTFGDVIPNDSLGHQPTGVAVADFNGDGLLDAVTSNVNNASVRELRGNGDGTLTFAAAYTVGSSPSGIVVGDFNGDGRPDVATANADSNTVSVLLNNGTFTPPPPPPNLRISDATVTEGNSGTAQATFTVELSNVSSQPVTVAYATANGTSAESDYQATTGTLTIPAGQTMGTITVLVNGDTNVEPNETFFVNLSSPSNATIADSQGLGTITNDDVQSLPMLSISDVTKKEGHKGSTTFTFTVTLSAPSSQTVTVSYATANGTALVSDNDYYAKSGTLTFRPGETTKTITITVRGDRKAELDEAFFVNLFSASGSAIGDAQGIGTILNDDGETQALQTAFSDPTLIEEVQTGKRRR